MKIGPYTLISDQLAIGAGGQGSVHEAELDGQRFALKLLHASDDDREAQERFSFEAEILRTIEHPNVVRCVNDGVDGIWRYIAMPRLPGRNLRFALQARGRFYAPDVISILRQVLSGLDVFHQLGAVHRDVKPENIQFDEITGHVWLLDAGYGRYIKKSRLTRTGSRLVGSEGYRAPESLRGYDYRASDLFCLGIVAYELLAGRHPWDGDDPSPRTVVPSLRGLANDCPAHLEELILHLMSWDVRSRPATAADALELLAGTGTPLRNLARRIPAWLKSEEAPALLFRVIGEDCTLIRDSIHAAIRPDAYIGIGSNDEIRTIGELAQSVGRDLLVAPNPAEILHEPYAPGATDSSADVVPSVDWDDAGTAESFRVASSIAVDRQAEHHPCSLVLGGYPIGRDGLTQHWLEVNERSIRDGLAILAPSDPFITQISVTLSALRAPTERAAIISAMSRHRPDGYLISLDDLTDTASEVDIVSALRFVLSLRAIAPCVVTSAATLDVIWLGLGIGIASDLRYRSQAGRAGTIKPSPRFVVPSICAAVDYTIAQRLLTRPAVKESQCPCPGCSNASTIEERLLASPIHNAAMVSAERARLSEVPPSARPSYLRSRIAQAMKTEQAEAVRGWQERIDRLSKLEAAIHDGSARALRVA